MKRYPWQISLFSLAILVWVILLSSGTVHYEIWDQIEYLSHAEIDFSVAEISAHTPRYFVVSPSYVIAEKFGWEPDTVFSWYVLSLISITSWIWFIARARISKRSPTHYFGFLVPFVLAFFINGRFAFGLFGLSLILLAVIQASFNNFRIHYALLVLIGLLYTSVSSGIFAVGLGFVVLSAVDISRTKIQGAKSSLKVILFWVFFGILSIPVLGLLWIFLDKNISYYGEGFDGIIGMLSHGLGFIFNPDPLVSHCRLDGEEGILCAIGEVLVDSSFIFFSGLGILFFGALFFLIWLKMSGLTFLAKRGLGLALLGGVFGITTLLSALFVMPVWISRAHSNLALHVKGKKAGNIKTGEATQIDVV